MQVNIFDIKRFAVHDGPGIRTTVFFKGCPLRCKWCHNPESVSAAPVMGYYAHKCLGCGSCVSACTQNAHIIEDGIHKFIRGKCIACGACVSECPAKALELYGRFTDTESIIKTLTEDKIFYDTSGGGITLSGGECLLQPEGCAEILRAMKESGINTAVDTCGNIPRSALDTVIPYTDIFLYDLKHIDSEKHRTGTGVENGLILDNLKYLSGSGQKIEIRIPLIVGYNDGAISEIGNYLKELRGITAVKILPYHNFAGSKYEAIGAENTLPPMPDDNGLKKAIAELRSLGLNAAE